MKLASGMAGGLGQWVSVSFHFKRKGPQGQVANTFSFSYLMQWVMMQGGRMEDSADATLAGSPHGSQDFRHWQLVSSCTVSPSPFPVVSNFDPSVQR